MAKITLKEDEIKHILDLHSQEKKRKNFFTEQSSNVRAQLQKFIDSGCIEGGSIAEINSKNPNRQFAIKKESKKTPGTFNYFFIDFTSGYYDATGKFTFHDGKWNCDHVQKAQVEKTKQQALATTEALSKRQQDYIDAWLVKYPEYKQDPTDVEKMSLKQIKIEAPKDIFPNGLILWYDPSGQKDIKGKDNSVLGDILTNQSVDRNACRKNVEDFFIGFTRRNSVVVDPPTITKAKQIVQACKDEHYGKWGIAGGGRKLDEYLDILSGKKAGGPTTRGADSVWRIK